MSLAESPLANDTRPTVLAAEHAGLVARATHDVGSDTVLCASPPVSTTAGTGNYTVQVSLNSLHYVVVAPFGL